MVLVISLFTVFANIFIGLLVYIRNPRSWTNRFFVIFASLVAAWAAANFISLLEGTPGEVLLRIRVVLAVVALMFSALYLFAINFPASKQQLSGRHIGLIAVFALSSATLAMTSLVFLDIGIQDGVVVPIPSVGIIFYAFNVVGLPILTCVKLFQHLRASNGMQHAQIGILLWGIGIAFSLAIITNFLLVNIFKNSSLVVLGPFFTLIFISAATYGIIRHRLLDIRFIAVRAVSYTLLALLATGVYTVFLFGIATILFNIPLEDIDLPFFVSGMGVAALLALTFQSVQRFIAELTNKVFYQGRYSSDDLLSELTRLMTRTIDIERMTREVLATLTREMRVTKAAFLTLEDHKASGMYGVGYRDHELLSGKIDTLVHALSSAQKHIVFEDLEEGDLKSFCRDSDIAVAFLLAVEDREVGTLIVGAKLSGEIYSSQDIQVLDIFAHEAGIAIQNAKAYAEIKKFSAELEQKVKERTRELQTAQERELAKAHEVARLKDEFVFIAAHELRAPVTVIKGFVELIGDSSTRVPKKIKEYLYSISAASTQLHNLVSDLLEIARSESGTMKIAVEPTYIIPIIEEAIDEFSPVAEKKRVTVALAVRGDIPKVLADMQKLKEVIMNLLDNAIKYNREDGRVDITVFEQSGVLITEIRDTGYGIPAKDQPQIFQKFFRAPTKETHEVLGTGLGLFVIRMLMEKMGGKVMFSSMEGKGSTFSFWLPITK